MRLRPRVACSLLAIAAISVTQSGCLEVKADLDRNGGGTLVLKVSNLDRYGDRKLRQQIPSPSVTLVHAEHAGDTGKYEVKFSDIRKLRTSALFRHLRVQHSGLNGSKRTISLSIPRRPPNTAETNLPNDDYVVIDLEMTLPGRILETNGTQTAATTSKWEIRARELIGKGFIGSRVAYDLAPAADATPKPSAVKQ